MIVCIDVLARVTMQAASIMKSVSDYIIFHSKEARHRVLHNRECYMYITKIVN